jgi:hypothetical protein
VTLSHPKYANTKISGGFAGALAASSSTKQRQHGVTEPLASPSGLASAPRGRTHPRRLECRDDRAIQLGQQRSEFAGEALDCQNRLGGAERLK